MDNSIDKICFQIRSIIIVKYFELFKVLEKETKSIFSKEINDVDETFKNKLYFLYGGKISININTASNFLYMDNKIFRKNEEFNELSFNQIIKICKMENKMKRFDFSIDSIQRKQEGIDFYSSCIKMINMRNKLAHEILENHFEDKDIVELLSEDNISKYIISELSTLDVSLMGIAEKQIYSNLIYLNLTIEKLKKCDSLLNFI